MAPMIFANPILNMIPLKVLNKFKMIRYFTFLDDEAEVVFRWAFKPAEPNIDFDKSNQEPCSFFSHLEF